MPRISIITTTYKHENFIAQTIESILWQSFTEWELLIWDDSPDDATWNVIQPYIQKYPDKIRAWHHQSNKGIVGNINFLLERISQDSEYIAFLEWDDMYTPDNIQKKLNIFYTYPEVQLVYNDLSFIDSYGKTIKKSFYQHKLPFSHTISWTQYFLSGKSIFSYSSMMIRKDVFSYSCLIRNIWDKKSWVSDFDLVGQILQKWNAYWIDEPLTFYRIHHANISLGTSVIMQSLHDLFIFLLNNNFIDYKEANLISSRITYSIAAWYLLEWKRFLALKFLFISLQKKPWDQIVKKIIGFMAILFPTYILRRVFYNRFYDA